MNIQHSLVNNLINHDKNNYRKYKQVHVNERIFKNSKFEKLNTFSTPNQIQPWKTILKTNNPNNNASYNSSNLQSGLVKPNQNLNRLNNDANRHYDIDYHKHTQNQIKLENPSSIMQDQEKRLAKFDTIINGGCCPIHLNRESKLKSNENCSDRYSQTFVNNLNLNSNRNRVLDLSGYLIFVTTSHQGDEIKVYG